MIKAIIFDMDGVIADSEELHSKAEKKVMSYYGIKISDEELEKYIGTTAKYMFERLIKKYQLETNFKKIRAEKNKILFPLLKKKLKAIKGVIPFIMNLKKMKIRLALASSSHKKVIKLVLNKLKLKNCFEVITSADDIKKSKPDPEIFLQTAAKLKLKPEECLVIEDAELGVKAAKKAGMRCIGYKNRHSSFGNQNLAKADFIVNNFNANTLNLLLNL